MQIGLSLGMKMPMGLSLVQRAIGYFTQTPSGSWGYLNITSISGNTVTSTGTITVPDGTTLTPNPNTNWIIV